MPEEGGVTHAFPRAPRHRAVTPINGFAPHSADCNIPRRRHRDNPGHYSLANAPSLFHMSGKFFVVPSCPPLLFNS
jgi:hypothetical protein